jgi:hypothetical protein
MRNFLLALVVVFLGLGLNPSCGGVQKTPQLALLECRIALLTPYLGEETADVVRQGLTQDPQAIARALYNLGLEPAEIIELGRKWHECAPPKPAPVLESDDAGIKVVPA